jgi:hypothetical protein
LNLKRLMFKNSDSDRDIEVGHTRSGRVFREVNLANLFKNNYGVKEKSNNFIGTSQKLQELHRMLK